MATITFNLTDSLWLNDSLSFYDSSSTSRPRNIVIRPYSMAQDILNFLDRYYVIMIIVVGVVGNGKNVYTFVRSKKKLLSPSYYLAALALNDVIFLVILAILWLGQFDIKLLNNRNGIYQTFYFLSSTSSCISGSFHYY